MKKDYLGKFLSFMTVITFIGVFISVMTQIITRYLPITLAWTEELSRLLFVASVCFAAPIAYRDYEFVIVDVLVDKMPVPLRKLTIFIINIAVILLFVIILKHGVDFAINGHRQSSSTLNFPMSIPYSMIPLSATCFIYYASFNLLTSIRELFTKEA